MSIVNAPTNPYELNNKVYAKPIPSGAPISFFINSEEPYSSPAFSDLVLSVFDCEDNEVIKNVSGLSDVVFSGGYRIYVQDMVITSLTIGKTYRLMIYDESTDELFLDLGFIRFVEPSPRYTEISYRNSSDIFNFSYESLPNFRNTLYVDLSSIDEQCEYDLTQYSEASTGDIRNQKSHTKYYYFLEGVLIDDDIDNGMKGLSSHDDIRINGVECTTKEGWQKETDIRSKLSKGTIELYDVKRNNINLKK